MKRLLSMLLMLCLLLGCFAGCNVAEKDPEGSSEQPSESQSESSMESGLKGNAESLSEAETETESQETLKKVYFSKDDIPGEQLDYNLIYEYDDFSLLIPIDSFALFETKAEFLQLFSDLAEDHALSKAMDQVDFDLYNVIAVNAVHTSTDTPFALERVILQEDRFVFVFQSTFEGASTEDYISQVSFVAVKKSDCSDKALDAFICAYSKNLSDEAPDVQVGTGLCLGSYYYEIYHEYQ